jgi:hypothetical protein
MASKPLHDDLCLEAVEALERYGSQLKAASRLGVPRATLQSRLQVAAAKGITPRKREEYEVTPLPDDDVSIDDLVAHRKRQFQKKREYEEASKLIPVKVKIQGPVGILHFGDPHVDDDGTDIEALERHARIVRETPGMFAANVGDTSNNWVGRLARLYADQSTSASQAWKLAEWFLGLCPWLYMISGNHDLWSGAGDPIKWIARQQGALYKASEARIALTFPNGRQVRVNARHDFAGSSQWNSAHGPMKAIQLGLRDHIAIAGHKHESGYGVVKDGQTGITMHAVKVASYKIYDRYARDKGFRDNSLSPCAVTVIDPGLPETHPDMVKVFWSPEVAAEYLTWRRERAA